jgi:hypothetical protein
MLPVKRSLPALVAALLVAACGGSEQHPKTAHHPHEDGDHDQHRPHLDVSSEIGALDEAQVTKTFTASVKSLQGCLERGSGRVEFLGGAVGFYVKVDSSGHASEAYLEQSTIGDRDTEKCMLDVLRAKQWPAPVGGQSGIAKKAFDFDPPNDVRPPTEWSADRVSSEIAAKSTEISKCKSSAPGTYSATMYVDVKGHVLSVGIAPPDAAGEQAVDCLVDVVRGTKFPSPGSWPAKVTFEL